MTNFLQVLNKLFSKKKKQINKSKRKVSIEKTSPRKAIISNLNSFNKEQLLVSISAIKKSLFQNQDIDIAMIGNDTYYTTCYLKSA